MTMNAIRLRREIDSETLHLPELRSMLGKTVEIIILEESPNGSEPPRPDLFMALAPDDPPLGREGLDALRADPRFRKFWAVLDVIGSDIVDPDAVAALRAASMT